MYLQYASYKHHNFSIHEFFSKRDMKVILKWFKRASLKINFQKTQFVSLNPLMTNVPHHIKTSQLVCNAYQLTHFYMMGNIYRY